MHIAKKAPVTAQCRVTGAFLIIFLKVFPVSNIQVDRTRDLARDSGQHKLTSYFRIDPSLM